MKEHSTKGNPSAFLLGTEFTAGIRRHSVIGHIYIRIRIAKLVVPDKNDSASYLTQNKGDALCAVLCCARRGNPGLELNRFMRVCQTGFNMYFGCQRSMDRAIVRDFRESLTLFIRQVASQYNLSFDPINQSLVGFAAEAILGMHRFIHQSDRNVFQRPSFPYGIHAKSHAGACTGSCEEKFVRIWIDFAATRLDWLFAGSRCHPIEMFCRYPAFLDMTATSLDICGIPSGRQNVGDKASTRVTSNRLSYHL